MVTFKTNFPINMTDRKSKIDMTCSGTSFGLPLNDEYWDKQYQQNNLGWDLNQVSPPLAAYFDQIEDKSISIMIPGCGSAYEAQYLLDLGFCDITLVDISVTLVSQLREKLINTPVKVVHQDFFELAGKYDLIVEQTLFCALSPSLRAKYVETMHRLLTPKGKLVGLLFNRTFEAQGPPFGGSTNEYTSLFEKHFLFHTIDYCTNSVEPRSGTELFINFRPIN
jgi:methyl halide transferase